MSIKHLEMTGSKRRGQVQGERALTTAQGPLLCASVAPGLKNTAKNYKKILVWTELCHSLDLQGLEDSNTSHRAPLTMVRKVDMVL